MQTYIDCRDRIFKILDLTLHPVVCISESEWCIWMVLIHVIISFLALASMVLSLPNFCSRDHD